MHTFRVITVNFGTVASAYANKSLAPCRIVPLCSCCTPGRNPGTSTKVINDILKASQNLTNLAALTEALLSKHPKKYIIYFRHKTVELNRTNFKFFTCCHFWLISNNSNSSSIHPSESNNDIFGIFGHDFEEVSFIHDG